VLVLLQSALDLRLQLEVLRRVPLVEADVLGLDSSSALKVVFGLSALKLIDPRWKLTVSVGIEGVVEFSLVGNLPTFVRFSFLVVLH
jgi:hypothetical protein